MTLIHIMPIEAGKFTNYFLCYPQSPIPEDPKEKFSWLWRQQGVLELCHNWNTENDPNFKYFNGNEREHKGFGHICVFVDELNKACDRFQELGVKFIKKPSDGMMKTIAFIADPVCIMK